MRPVCAGIAIAIATTLAITGCTMDAEPAASSANAVPTATSGPSVDPSDPPPTTTAPTPAVGPTAAPTLPVVSGTLDETLELATGITVTVDSITAIQVTAETPGDVAGSAVAVSVTVTNASSEAQSVDSAVVTLVTPEGQIGIPTLAGGAEPLVGSLQPGQSAHGRYNFMLDPAAGRDITISVNYAAGEPVAEFTGRTS